MTKILSFFTNSNWSEALGWTLVHSVWQAAIIALFLGFAMILLNKKSAQVRYFTAVGAFLAILTVSVSTFFTLLEVRETSLSATPMMQPIYIISQVEEISQAQISDFSAYFSKHLPMLVSIWYVGVALLLLRFITSYAYTKRLKNYRTQEVSAEWQKVGQNIAWTLGLNQKITLLESALIEMPMVIGAIKPIILLPMGMLTGLESKQIESILAHEIAHIQRHDYLVNLVQSFVEILLFFNPFIWWVSNIIRKERENCCDDIAVQYTGDQLTYVKSLAAVEELRQVHLAMAFGGQKNSLLHRIKRIIETPKKEAGFGEGVLTSFFLMGFILLISFSAEAHYDLAKITNFAKNLNLDVAVAQFEKQIVGDFWKENMPQMSGITSENTEKMAQADTIIFGQGYKMITKKSGKVEFYHNDKLIPHEDLDKHKDAFVYRERVSQSKNMIFGFEGGKIDTVKVFDDEDIEMADMPMDFDFDIDAPDDIAPLEPISELEKFVVVKSRNGNKIIRIHADSLHKKGNEIIMSFGNKNKRFKMTWNEEMEKLNLEMDSLGKHLDMSAKEMEKLAKKFESEMFHFYAGKPEKNVTLNIGEKDGQIIINRGTNKEERTVIIKNGKVIADDKKGKEIEIEKEFRISENPDDVRKKLIKEGIISEDDKQLDIQIKNGEAIVNGKKLTKKEMKKLGWDKF